MRQYESYKSITLPWLNRVPSHWQFLRNKTFLTESKKVVGDEWLDYTLLSLTLTGIIPRDVSSGKGKFPKDFNTYKIVQSGNMVFCLFDIDETPRTVGLSHHDGMLTGAYNVFHIANINPRFFQYYYLCLDNAKALKPLYTGLRKTIKTSVFLGTKIPVPPRAEQDQIVCYLDWQVSKINKLIAAKKKQIALYEEQKFTLVSSEFQKLCKLTTARLALRAIKIGSGKTPRGGATVYSTEGVLFIRSQNVYPSGVITDGAYYISQEIDSEMASTRVYRGDVLLNITGGSIGRACVYDLAVPANVNQHVCIIRVDEKFLIPEFVSLYLNSKCGQDLIWGNQKPGNRQSLTFPQIGSFPIPVLSTKEQERFVDSIMDRGQSISSIVKSINTEIDTLHELRTRIISDVVTGQIDVRNIEVPEFEMVEEIDESADEDDVPEETEGQEE